MTTVVSVVVSVSMVAIMMSSVVLAVAIVTRVRPSLRVAKADQQSSQAGDKYQSEEYFPHHISFGERKIKCQMFSYCELDCYFESSDRESIVFITIANHLKCHPRACTTCTHHLLINARIYCNRYYTLPDIP